MSKWPLQSRLLFQVGCGAIGCEMLKNFALLGVGLAKSSGEVGNLSVFPLLCLTVFLYVLQYISLLGDIHLVKLCILHLSILRYASQTQTL